MRDWLSHLVLSELYERRQRDAISIHACQVVRESVKTGDLASGVEYLVDDAPADEGSGSDWFEDELRTVLQAWEGDGSISADRAADIRDRLDAEQWGEAADALVSP